MGGVKLEKSYSVMVGSGSHNVEEGDGTQSPASVGDKIKAGECGSATTLQRHHVFTN